MSIVVTVALFAAVLVAVVVFVVRTALQARITDDGDIPDPLDDYVRTAHATFAETRDGFTRTFRSGHTDDPAYRFRG